MAIKLMLIFRAEENSNNWALTLGCFSTKCPPTYYHFSFSSNRAIHGNLISKTIGVCKISLFHKWVSKSVLNLLAQLLSRATGQSDLKNFLQSTRSTKFVEELVLALLTFGCSFVCSFNHLHRIYESRIFTNFEFPEFPLLWHAWYC